MTKLDEKEAKVGSKVALIQEVDKGGYGLDLRPDMGKVYDVVKYNSEWGWHIKYRPTARGFPTLWEFGGSSTNKGVAQIIGDERGRPTAPVYIKRHGELACGYHALFIAKVGMQIAALRRHKEKWICAIFVVVDIIPQKADSEYGILKLALVDAYTGEASTPHWPIPDTHRRMVEAALEKARRYHCREPLYYYKEGKEQKGGEPC